MQATLLHTHMASPFAARPPRTISQLERVLAGGDWSPHPDFRLWLTAAPHPGFPPGLLHLGPRLTGGAPSGFRAGMQAALRCVGQDTLDAVARPDWRQLLYITAFFHNLLLGRRRYGPVGWSAPHAFDQADLTAAIHFLQARCWPRGGSVCLSVSGRARGGGLTSALGAAYQWLEPPREPGKAKGQSFQRGGCILWCRTF